MGKEVGRVVLWGFVIVFLALPMLAAAGPGLIASATRLNGPAAAKLTCAFPVDHVCPANANKLDEQARQRQATSPTSVQPYGPPNGPVRPLPSVQPAAPAEPSGVFPRLGEAPSAGLLGEIPALGPVIEGGLKAIGPGAAR